MACILLLELCCKGPWFTSIQENGCDKGVHQSYLGTERNTYVIPSFQPCQCCSCLCYPGEYLGLGTLISYNWAQVLEACDSLDITCPLCRASVENEAHFTLCCSALNDLRERFIPDKFCNQQSSFKHVLLLSTENQNIIKNFSINLYLAFKRREIAVNDNFYVNIHLLVYSIQTLNCDRNCYRSCLMYDYNLTWPLFSHLHFIIAHLKKKMFV